MARSGLRSAAPRRWTTSSVPADLHGKVVLVTGVGRVGQIGHAVARGLGRAGAKLLLVDVNAVGLADRVKEFGAEGIAAKASAGDLTQPEAARAATAAAQAQFGGLDIVVNVAGGFFSYGPFTEVKPELLDRELAVNFKTAFFMCQAAVPLLLARGRSHTRAGPRVSRREHPRQCGRARDGAHGGQRRPDGREAAPRRARRGRQ